MVKEQILKIIEDRIDTIQTLLIECIDLIHKTGYNEGIDAAIKTVAMEQHNVGMFEEIRKLKK